MKFMDSAAVIERLQERQARLKSELEEVEILLEAMLRKKRPGKSPDQMAAMRAAKANKS